jgi:DNA repair exonuclease SbcCD ATPase subunit
MEMLRAEWEYMYSYERGELSQTDFNAGGVTAVIGINLDQDTSNGSGKSSILKIIYYLLFGRELNGEAIETLSNRAFDRGHFGEIEFEDKGDIFKIQRFHEYRPNRPWSETKLTHVKDGSRGKQSGVRFYINGELFGDKKLNGEAVSVTEIQKMILRRLGITPELFLSSVMTAQDSRSNFLMATDTKKKELISELLDLSVYESAYDVVKKETETAEKQVELAESRVEEINRGLETKESEKAELIVKDKAFIEEVNREVESLKSRYTVLEGQFVTIKKGKPQTHDVKPLEALLVEKKEILSALSQSQVVTETEELQIITDQINDNEMILKQIETESSRLNGKLQALGGNADDIAKAISALTEELARVSLAQKAFGKSELSVLSTLGADQLKAFLEACRKEEAAASTAKAVKEATVRAIENEIAELETSDHCPTCSRAWGDDHEKERQSKISQLRQQIMSAKTTIEECSQALSLKKVDQAEAALRSLALNEELKRLSSNESEVKEIQAFSNNLLLKAQKIRLIGQRLQLNKTHELDCIREAVKKHQDDIAKSNKEIQDLAGQVAAARMSEQVVSQWEQSVQSAKEKLFEIGDRVKQAKSRANPYKELIEAIDLKIAELLERRETNRSRIETLEEDLKYLSFWKNGFGPTGIRSFISDEVVINLNEIVRDYLNDLFDGAISVVFESESISQKGGVSNKINTKFYLNGKETPIGLLSGGERQRVVLAIDLALSDIAESRMGTKINLKFLDEPFNGIDGNGQLKSIALFSKIANRKSGFFIITHDPSFQALCQNTLFVVKENEISKLVTREQFRKAS